jgi:hypothetical protein
VLALVWLFLQDPEPEYQLPWPEGKTFRCIQGVNGAYSHKDMFAYDFDLPEGEKFCAARSGRVIDVKEDSDKGGPDRKFMNDANTILIDHGDGTYGFYGHLKKDGALVEKGDYVFTGEVIGLSGKTGFASGPHLHFEVLRGQKTIAIKFAHGEVVEGRRYTSKTKPVVAPEQKKEILDAHAATLLPLKYSQYAIAQPHLKKLADMPGTFELFAKARAQLKEIEEEGKRVILTVEAEIENGQLEDAIERVLLHKVAFRGLAAEARLKELEAELMPKLGRRADNAKLAHSQLLVFLEGLRLETKGKREDAKAYYKIVSDSDISTVVTRWARERLNDDPK